MKNIHLFLVVFCLLIVSSCRNDGSEFIEDVTTGPEPVVKIFSSFNGFVFDLQGEPLVDARIEMSGKETNTDEQGYFFISGLANNNGAYLKASKDGFFDAFGNVIPSEEGVGHVQFTLKERNPSGIISSGNESSVSLDNGSEISFKANSFVDKNGASYSGNVTVYADYIDPMAANFSTVMPGDLLATDLEENSVILQSFGMLNVELESDNGDALQLSNTATLTVDIPDGLLAQADDEIPLWYFDTESGLWIEEGAAVLKNGVYVGEVSHFTLWNCDVPMDYVVLSGTVTARGPLPNVTIKVTWIENGQMATTTADDQGNFDGKVPANAELLVEVYDRCGEVIWSQTIGPLTEDEFLSIVLNPDTYESVLFTGNLVCGSDAVTNGYVLIDLDDGGTATASVDDQGDFSIEVLTCNSLTADLTGVNSDELEQGSPVTYDVTNGDVMVGSLESCGNVIEYYAEFDFENWTDLYIPNATSTDGSNGDSLQVFQINFIDTDDQNNSVIYDFTLLNWTGDLANPVWAYSVSFQLLGSSTMPHYLPGELNSDNINVTITPDYIEVTIVNVSMIEQVSGDTDNGTFFVRAVLE